MKECRRNGAVLIDQNAIGTAGSPCIHHFQADANLLEFGDQTEWRKHMFGATAQKQYFGFGSILGIEKAGESVQGQIADRSRVPVLENLVFANEDVAVVVVPIDCLLYTSPSPRDQRGSRMPSSA